MVEDDAAVAEELSIQTLDLSSRSRPLLCYVVLGQNSCSQNGDNFKDSSRWVVTLIRGLYKPHIGPLPFYEPYMSLIWGYPPGNYPPETVPE